MIRKEINAEIKLYSFGNYSTWAKHPTTAANPIGEQQPKVINHRQSKTLWGHSSLNIYRIELGAPASIVQHQVEDK